MLVWPALRPNDLVRVSETGRLGIVNQIEPDANGEAWVFEILLDEADHAGPDRRAETAVCRDEELELVARSGLEHEPEIELDLKTPNEEPAIVAAEVLHVMASRSRSRRRRSGSTKTASVSS